MKIAVIGGGLQGVEAAYLAKKAGWQVLLIDRKANPPAPGICHGFVQMDVTGVQRLEPILKDADLVVPALESRAALDSLVRWSKSSSVPFAFDMDAYAITSSKIESDRLFARIGVPAPLPWPECGFPVIAKPSAGSGSENVQLFHNRRQLEERFSHPLPPQGWVLQEYIHGPSFSLEVVGYPGHYTTLQVIGLEMDAGYDCKRVLAPAALPAEQVREFGEISLQIARAIQLKGVMDVEVILHNGRLKVLEIDARLPSQTPTAVYRSMGVNMLEKLAVVFSLPGSQAFVPGSQTFVPGSQTPFGVEEKPAGGISPKAVIYEHIKVSRQAVEVCGEHIMAEAGPLHCQEDFFGADEALTSYVPGSGSWVATMIITGAAPRDAWEKREEVIGNIQRHFGLDTNSYKDPVPAAPAEGLAGE